MSSLKQYYFEHVIKELMATQKYENIMQVPRIEAVILNRGISDLSDKKILVEAAEELGLIAGQKPVITKARKSIAGFKIREGWALGCKVTLRKDRMWEFLERLLSISIPRIRDFRGLNDRSFDGQGNYSLGIKEQSIFPEIRYENIKNFRGLDITIKTSARTDKDGKALLRALKFPLRNSEVAAK
jgi:large subunit ribosomal protein L5